MVKGKGKGSDAFEDMLADKSYKNGILEVIKSTPVQPADFDSKALRLLDALAEKGQAMEACQKLRGILQGSQRKKISNWRGYVYSLLRNVDPSVYAAMKESKEKETRRRRKTDEPTPAGSQAKKEFNKGAAEFVPGKPWNTEAEPKSMRKDAAEFVPTQVILNHHHQTLLTPPPAANFDFHPQAVWPSQTTPASLKPDAQEFFPGVSAWAGAMKPKSKAKAKTKDKAKGPAKPGPVSPGLQGSRDADTAAGGASPAKAKGSAVSERCQGAFGKVFPKSKDSRQVTGVFSAAECSAVLAAAEQLGLSPAEQDRAGGSPGLVTVDPWLADLLWQRISPFMPSIVNSKQVLGLEESLEVRYTERGSENPVVQLCLKPGNDQLSAGDLFVLPRQPGPKASWLSASLRCGESSWANKVQAAMGLGGPNKERRLRALTATTVAAAAVIGAVAFIKKRR